MWLLITVYVWKERPSEGGGMYMAILSEKERRRDCGRRSPAKHRYTKSCARLKDLLYFKTSVRSTWQKFIFFMELDKFVMLVMGWGGQSTTKIMVLNPSLCHEIPRSNREIKVLGIVHDDLWRDNIIWNEELRRTLIIDFHHSTLKCQPTSKRPQTPKRQLCRTEPGDVKRLHVL